jgi:glutamate synthase (ferredoxin)
VKVLPNDYKRVIEAQRKMLAAGMSEDEAAMAAFEANAHDAARVGGK